MWKNFDLDLRDGLSGETLAKELLTYGLRIEVKTDFEFLKTGNVFVETHQYGRPSGVSTTEADYWAFVLGNVVVFIPTFELRELVKNGQSKKGVGDNGGFDGVLIRAYRLVCHSRMKK